MKPPMHQRVSVATPQLDENGQVKTDRYGRPLSTKPVESAARVQYRTQLVRDNLGQERRASLEIDLPPTVDPPIGATIEFTTASGLKGSGSIVSKDEAVNLAGNIVYYRTVFVDA